jgi:hypothetical protein
MNSELENYLKNKYQKMYVNFKHIECSNGWFKLILWLSKYLQDYIDQQNVMAELYPDRYLPVKQIVVQQIKEKFGTLRFYVEGGNERTEAIISFAEYISGFICEISGKTDNIVVNNNRGRFRTLHVDLCYNLNDTFFVDDEELRNILNSK